MRPEPVVLVHGLGSSFAHGWQEPGWVDILGDAGRTVVPVDLLGHGTAPRPHDPAAYADIAAGVRDALPPDGRADVIGFSLGAQLSLRVAAEDPSRIRRLVVIGVGENLFREDSHEFLAAAFESGPAEDDVMAKVFVKFSAAVGNDPKAIAACLRRERAPFTIEELARVTCPVLVVIGDRDFAGPADPLVAALPDARLVTLPGVDHFQSPRDFRAIDAALEFLDAE